MGELISLAVFGNDYREEMKSNGLISYTVSTWGKKGKAYHHSYTIKKMYIWVIEGRGNCFFFFEESMLLKKELFENKLEKFPSLPDLDTECNYSV